MVTFKDINLFDSHLDNTFVDISLRGKQITVQNQQFAQDGRSSWMEPNRRDRCCVVYRKRTGI